MAARDNRPLAEVLSSDRLSGLLRAPVLATRVVDAHDGTTGRAVLITGDASLL